MQSRCTLYCTVRIVYCPNPKPSHFPLHPTFASDCTALWNQQSHAIALYYTTHNCDYAVHLQYVPSYCTVQLTIASNPLPLCTTAQHRIACRRTVMHNPQMIALYSTTHYRMPFDLYSTVPRIACHRPVQNSRFHNRMWFALYVYSTVPRIACDPPCTLR